MHHDSPLSSHERQEFDRIVGALRCPPARLRAPQDGRPRRLFAASGWPAWATALLGLALVTDGCATDSGAPLLWGAVLTFTCNHWLRLPRAGLRPRHHPEPGLR